MANKEARVVASKRTCPACGITTDGKLFFPSVGRPFDREECIARICQYAKKGGCLNDESNLETATLLKILRSD